MTIAQLKKQLIKVVKKSVKKKEELDADEAKDSAPVSPKIAKPTLTPKASYKASKDPTTVRKNGHPGMGWAGYLKQINQKSSDKDDIREYNATVGGFHEIIPTELRNDISNIPNDAKTKPSNTLRDHFAQVQSGARMSTKLTFFKKKNEGNGEIAAHSGGLNPAHTTGQKAAHDSLRKTYSAALKMKLTGKKLIVAITLNQIKLMPPGEEFLTDTGITGKKPALPNIGAIEAPSANAITAARITPNRFELAQSIHTGREGMKERIRAVKRSIPGLETAGSHEGGLNEPARIASPSKARRPAFFNNGEAKEPLPDFPGTHVVADIASWVTQPMRLQP